MDTADYFAPLLPWQDKAWEQVRSQHKNGRLPHGLLAAGPKGIGKRAFVARLVAWLLCANPGEAACGACQSCLWLKAGAHPNFAQLPSDPKSGIKIDDVRALQEFFYTKSDGVRIALFDDAENASVAASNALLKTLEEPGDGVFLVLVSDRPSLLLPTIKSRAQTLPLQRIDAKASADFVAAQVGDAWPAQKLLLWADYAPLLAADLPNQAWFGQRKAWLGTYAALYNGQRSPTQASDYWQKNLDFVAFLRLSWFMLLDLWRLSQGVATHQDDADFADVLAALRQGGALEVDRLSALNEAVTDGQAAFAQNVQGGVAYDAFFARMAALADCD